MARYQAITESGGHIEVEVDPNNIPDECPQCHNKGTFSPLWCFYNSKAGVNNDNRLEVIYRCPNSHCYEIFIGFYQQNLNSFFVLKRAEPKKYITREFPEIIKSLSTEFSDIYNQSLKAEHDGLKQICGPGYRKALEFLIKDYLIRKTIEEKDIEAIKNELLGVCIANRIDDQKIKNVAKRAVWLGNDETHYIRKWGEKDLQDLKKLIDLTIHWIEVEDLTTQLMKEMPDNSSK